jgi:hypothetical protein
MEAVEDSSAQLLVTPVELCSKAGGEAGAEEERDMRQEGGTPLGWAEKGLRVAHTHSRPILGRHS